MVFEDSRMISGDSSRLALFCIGFPAWFFGREEGALEFDFLPLFELLEGLRETFFESVLDPIKHDMLSFETSNLTLKSAGQSPSLRLVEEMGSQFPFLFFLDFINLKYYTSSYSTYTTPPHSTP